MLESSIEWDVRPSAVVGLLDDFLGALEDALEARVEVVVESVASMAQRFAPVDTGELRDSIRGTMEGVAETLVVEGEVVAGAAHAPFQEFGTIHHAPQPYLAPALDAHRDVLLEQAEAAVLDARGQTFGY